MSRVCCSWLDELDQSYCSHYLTAKNKTCACKQEVRADRRKGKRQIKYSDAGRDLRANFFEVRHGGNSDVLSKCSQLRSEQAATSEVERRMISDIVKIHTVVASVYIVLCTSSFSPLKTKLRQRLPKSFSTT